MPLDCLENIIGVDRTCAQETPISGLFIQDLPGITLKVADAVVGSEYASGVRFLKAKITFAKNLMLAEIRTALQSKLKYGNILENQNIGYVDYNTIVPSELNKLKGIQIQVRDYPYLQLSMQSISVFASESKIISVYIYDLVTGALLKTIPVTSVANAEVNVIVSDVFYSQRKSINLFICTDSDLNHYQAKLNKAHCPGCESGISNAYSFISYSEIPQGIPVVQGNLKAGSSTGGLSVSYSLGCSLEPYLCNLGGLLGFPLLYKAGMVIMDEAINTGRLNGIVLNQKDEWETLRDYFASQYTKVIESALNGLKMPNDICFECNRSIRNVVQIP